ncbi:hypothetical protein HOLleu_08076 [Holothuria leucospilota]|uniref:Uncharacterized protein n=1 Tax=Holothuria leucospilota TaxID=206669 RepID=A0A9Q1HHH0_HOLLE|nr:hypothetical protein HOLleu_08076 [Holothuria leucospilota]
MTCHTTTQDSTWKKFVEGHLLKDNVIDGVSIISKLGEILYTYGKFTELSQVEVQQFLSQFENTKKQQEETCMQKGFHLNVTANNRPVVFYIHKKTRLSMQLVKGATLACWWETYLWAFSYVPMHPHIVLQDQPSNILNSFVTFCGHEISTGRHDAVSKSVSCSCLSWRNWSEDWSSRGGESG